MICTARCTAVTCNACDFPAAGACGQAEPSTTINIYDQRNSKQGRGPHLTARDFDLGEGFQRSGSYGLFQPFQHSDQCVCLHSPHPYSRTRPRLLKTRKHDTHPYLHVTLTHQASRSCGDHAHSMLFLCFSCVLVLVLVCSDCDCV